MKQDVTTQLNNPEFVAWLSKPSQKEKYQAITKEQFNKFYDEAKVHAKRIAQAIGIDTESIETDTPDTRLNAMIAEGDVVELHGLYWRHEALDDATMEFYGLDSDSEQKDEESDNEF